MSTFRGIITSVTSLLNKRMRATIKGRSNENLVNIPIYQQFGFQSNPPPLSECVVVQAGELYQIISTEGRHAVLTSGNVMLYNKGYTCRIKLEGNNLTIFGASKVVIESAAIELGAGVDLKTLVNSSFKDLFNKHCHNDPSSGVTGPPIACIPPIAGTLMTDSNLTSKTKAE
jgi:phage gp45-like